jgi:hypothetical protein
MITLQRARTSQGVLMAGRIAGAALTGWSAGIHLYLWTQGYRDIATIGPLFLLHAISGAILALALLTTPIRFLTIVSALGALFAAGSLAALILSLTVGMFGFTETPNAELVTTTLIVESAGFLILALFTILRLTSAARARSTGTPSAATH